MEAVVTCESLRLVFVNFKRAAALQCLSNSILALPFLELDNFQMKKSELLILFTEFMKEKHSLSENKKNKKKRSSGLNRKFQELGSYMSNYTIIFLNEKERNVLTYFKNGPEDSLEFLISLLQALDNDLNRVTRRRAHKELDNYCEQKDLEKLVSIHISVLHSELEQ